MARSSKRGPIHLDVVWVRSRLGQRILTEIEVTGGTLVPSELNIANDLLELAVQRQEWVVQTCGGGVETDNIA